MKKENKAELTERFLTALKENNNNITLTGRLLGLSRGTARKIASENGVVPSPRWISNIGRNSTPPAAMKACARDAEILEKLPELMREMQSKEKIAKALGVGKRAVLRVMKANGIVMPPRVQAGIPKGPRKLPERPKHLRDDEMIPRIPALMEELRSMDKVARALQTSRRTLARIMQAHNITMPPPIDKDAELQAKFPELLEKHFSQAMIAKHLGISENTVSRIMRKYGLKAPAVPRPPRVVSNKVTKANPDRYANIRERLPQLFAEHKSQAGIARALGVDKKTISRALKATGYKPPQVLPGPAAGTKPKQRSGSTPFNGSRIFAFMNADGGEPVIVEFCADPKMEKARQRLLQSGSQNDDAVWEVHQAYGVPLRDVYRLRYENRERAKGRM